MQKMRYKGAILGVIFWILGLGGAWAENPEIEMRVKALSDELRCPTCQGLSVLESEAGFSVQMRNKVRELIEQGQSDEAIRAYFVERYGEWILRSPPKTGFNWLLWGLPGLGIALALAGVWLKSQKWAKRQAASVPAQTEGLTPEEQKILEADLKRFQNS